MKNVLFLLLLLSCNSKSELHNEVNLKKIYKITYNNHIIKEKDKDNLVDLIKILKKSDGIWKFYKKQPFILQYENKEIDTLYTNGFVFQYKDKYFVSKKIY